MFDFTVIARHLPELSRGAGETLFVSLLSILVGFLCGHLLCFGKMSSQRLLRRACSAYISAIRGTPLLVQLAIIFYCLPLASINIPALWAAVICLSVNTAAFQAEILRGGFQALPAGQVEAAYDLGLTPWQIRMHIQIPQVFRTTLPALFNETINTVKNSALISTIAVTDLMRVSQTLASTTFRPIESYTVAGVMYFTITYSLSKFGLALEKKLDSH
jgi:polar amino acid transport system permease protein